jgi:hypothetical protein
MKSHAAGSVPVSGPIDSRTAPCCFLLQTWLLVCTLLCELSKSVPLLRYFNFTLSPIGLLHARHHCICSIIESSLSGEWACEGGAPDFELCLSLVLKIVMPKNGGPLASLASITGIPPEAHRRGPRVYGDKRSFTCHDAFPLSAK